MKKERLNKTRLNKTQVAERRKKVGEWANKGWTQQEIAAALDVSQATVSRDLEVFNEGLRQETVHNLTELRNRELYKLNLVEAEAWAAWRRSQQPVRAASITNGPVTCRVLLIAEVDGDRPGAARCARLWGIVALCAFGHAGDGCE